MIDTDAHVIRAAGEPIELTPREYTLLEFLATTPGRVYSREQLLANVWESSVEWQAPATVDEHVYRIRRKLTSAGRPVAQDHHRARLRVPPRPVRGRR